MIGRSPKSSPHTKNATPDYVFDSLTCAWRNSEILILGEKESTPFY
jgi:hypothetical protein